MQWGFFETYFEWNETWHYLRGFSYIRQTEKYWKKAQFDYCEHFAC